MTYFVGIDGGQSSTVAIVGDEFGRILGRATAGPADEVAQGADSVRMRDALRDACASALRASGAADGANCECIVAGVSGFDGRLRGVAPEMPTDRFILMHDAPIAHAGALGGLSGVVVIAGTGSVAYRVLASGSSETVGGWGYLFGDEGSAFWMARSAIAHAATHAACDSTPTILGYFEHESLRALVRDVYHGVVSRERVASFASVAIERAQTGDACLSISTAGAAIALAKLAASSVGDASEQLPIAFVGGLMKDGWFKALVYAHTRALLPGVRIVEPRYEPVYGALLHAYKEAGFPIQGLIE